MDISDGHPGRHWIAEVDGLRALAALAVIFAHFGPAPLVPSPHSFFAFLRALDVLSLANLAVTFFYTLSSFLLTYLGVREFDRSGSFDVKRFYLRRGFRIWPLYFTILAIDLVLAAPWGPHAPAHSLEASQWAWITGHVWTFAGFLSNWSLALNYVGAHVDRTPGTLAILWSIAVEEQFYLFFPLLLLVIDTTSTQLFPRRSVTSTSSRWRRFFNIWPSPSPGRPWRTASLNVPFSRSRSGGYPT